MGAKFQISLASWDKTAQADDGREHCVMGILAADGEPTPFYFGFVANFEIETRLHILQHASLTVFHDVYAGELSSFFRAEWDWKAASDTTSRHAQPHWHFVQRPERIEGIVRTFVSPPREFEPGGRSNLFAGLADHSRFHFAMTSLWDKSRMPCHKQLFDPPDFPEWFRSLTTYVAGQIEYLLSKAPPPKPAEFVPP